MIGNFSNGKNVNVIMVKIIPNVKNSTYVLLYSFSILFHTIGVKTSPKTVTNPIA